MRSIQDLSRPMSAGTTNLRPFRSIGVLVCVLALASCRKEPGSWTASEEHPWASGGSQTVFDAGTGAFSHGFPQMSATASTLHGIGDIQFEQTFVSAPAPVNPGLGPVFNSVSCTSCHVGDGRGKPPAAGEQPISMLFRLSVPGQDVFGGPLPAPGFGGQLQPRAIFGVQPEADVSIAWTEEEVILPDGGTAHLRTPQIAFTNAYTAFPGDMLWSPRVAPPVFGLGLLEAIAGADIRSNADEQDANADGISGKVNEVWDIAQQRTAIGRFGWKAEQPTLLQQCAAAYNEDMGVTNPLFILESTHGQPQYDGLNDDVELTDSVLHAVAFYVRTLAVPARRNTGDPQVVRGEELFSAAKCDRCHIPEHRTAVNVAFPPVSNQRIFPYTDLLLHDMGDALSDNRPSYRAEGAEWRTPPLWGIGLTQVVNGHQNFLHDGRARSLLEAVLWHGGEAEASAQAVRMMTASERQALLAFLGSL
ncbi:MAG TPA: di-heme oxidoredictase family protein [Flavobacteriales bacterium]|nr:di-heme oxidoredictase family protein [Flavobacteriales bacterium]